MATILVIEDDAAIRRGLADGLRFHGFEVREAGDGAAGLDAALAEGISLVLLDLLMPRKDGLAVLGELRLARPTLPVVILTARGEERDRVRGLNAGADDYIVKPFGLDEVLARVRAVLRRSAERPRWGGGRGPLSVGGVSVDFERREVCLPGGARTALSEREAAVLAYLAANSGRAVTREELLRAVWGIDPAGVQTRTVDMTVARLREALGDDSARGRVVRTVRGRGYMLADGGAAGEGA